MNIDEIIKQTHLYFGKNRNLLKKKVLSFKFDGTNYKNWQNKIKQLTSQPFDLRYLIFDDVTTWILEEKHSEIDWHWLGDLSWTFDILLNQGIEKGYDWDKKLAVKCGGTARILRVYVSDIIPCFVMDTFYMTYNKKEKCYEFGPLNLTIDEKILVNKVKSFLKKQNLTFIDRKNALTKYPKLFSDCNSDGDATLFDALFCDTSNYQTEIVRFNDKQILEKTGKSISWREYYDKRKKLISREEHIHFPSRNGLTIITDGLGQITEVSVGRYFGKKHQQFTFDIIEEYEKRKAEKIKLKS